MTSHAHTIVSSERRPAPASKPRWRQHLSVLSAALFIAGCGGGGDDTAAESAQSASREKAQAFVPPTAIPGDANVKGMWSPVYNWPLIAVHTVLMPDGRVMSYGTTGTGQQTAKFIYDVWDSSGAPNAGHLTLPNGTITDIFCSSQLVLPLTGSVFIAGGDNWTGTTTTNTGNNNSNVFDPKTNTLTHGPNMLRPRWYSTSTTLLNGDTYIQGGSGGADFPEVRDTSGAFTLLSGTATSALSWNYPRNYVAPNGKIFGYDASGAMYWVDPTKVVNGVRVGSLTTAGQFSSAYAGRTSTSAMYRPGHILQFGGPGSNGAITIDITGAAPVVTPTQSLSSMRQWVNATVLPDGKVLATSGSAVENVLTGVNNIAEIWNPTTGQWTQGYAGVQPRLYHSNALLLPDGSVLVSGGGAPAPVNNLNAEIYYPPYLFNAAGQRAARPSITAGPDSVQIGATFNLGVSGAASVSRVTMVKTGSTTHSFNMEQRFIDLTYVAKASGVSVQAPTHAVDAPPGYYQIFVFNEAGVPSISKIVNIGVAANQNPAVTPVITNPGAKTATVGTATTLGLAATDPNGDALTYGATGLPPGLALNPSTGAITGTPTTAGTYNVVATVTDGVNGASANFVWTVSGSSVVLTVSAPATPGPVTTGAAATYTATATGTGLQYQWNFGDGTATTAWSPSPTITHAFATSGTFTVSFNVQDASGTVQTRSFVQTVYVPATTITKPSMSSNLLVETPASGNARLWVVNQDNDSVSAFDAVTNAKLAEVAVGAAPRTLALANNGMLWVTNKQGASISVINTTTRTVTRTITLPRGSQPFGVAISPTATQAFVALEATGQLLKFDTGSYAQTGSATLAQSIRHVSVSGDGASVYVSRFITPPLPGEGTAAVATTTAVGGQVMVVNAGSMALTKTIILSHSDVVDAENQGSGIPNYLGAVALSPDGSQAFVPSKQDNIKRGRLRNGLDLNFQNTVRAVSSRIVLATGQEDLSKRVDHDNSSVASAALFDSRGVNLFVALETSREVAVLDATGAFQRMRFDVGRAPQGLALSADGNTLYVSNFMDRTVGVYDLRPLLQNSLLSVPLVATLSSVGSEKLAANVLSGKQLFYDARDTRLSRDSYMSCATCHNDGGHDGRVWDMTSQGEGLRNTIALRGRAGAEGLLHWSGNFDEVQDFEGQIRTLTAGTGLMSDADFNTGTRNQPLGDKKAGLSPDLDAMAAYVGSLATFDQSPFRGQTGALTNTAINGRSVFQQQNCAVCHGGPAFTNSATVTPMNIGSLKPSSGNRLGGPLTGIDVPTLRDVWETGPYLHDGSAPTLEAAVNAHKGAIVNATNMSYLVEYLREIGGEEPTPTITAVPGAGTGLTGEYFNNKNLVAPTAFVRNEALDFDWGTGSPGVGVNPDMFSARWKGYINIQTSGPYYFREITADGNTLSVNYTMVISNWTQHGVTTDTTGPIYLNAGQRYYMQVEFVNRAGPAVMRLQWQTPGTNAFTPIPIQQLTPLVP